MGDIKSTLDIVMEKTKHLSMSNEEKKEQSFVEAKKKMNSILQKFLDGVIKLELIHEAVSKIDLEGELTSRHLILEIIFERLKLGQDNAKLLAFLYESIKKENTTLESILSEFKTESEKLNQGRLRACKEILKSTCQISGSAVIPILNHDKTWQEENERLQSTFGKKLSAEKSRLSATLLA